MAQLQTCPHSYNISITKKLFHPHNTLVRNHQRVFLSSFLYGICCEKLLGNTPSPVHSAEVQMGARATTEIRQSNSLRIGHVPSTVTLQ